MVDLSDRELLIMQALWRDGPMTAQGIQNALPARLDNSTVRTFLRILEAKGHVAHDRRGRAFVFRARTPRDRVVRKAVDQLLTHFFDGSIENLIRWTGASRPSSTRRPKTRGPAPPSAAPAESPHVVEESPSPTSPDGESWLL
ncbi:MAG: BlaI/MecI/CopY family transcriptional regulator [Phycisphaerae bacterium]|nr:BlaI/MecI/CopY family transcriptional regulator [Phycisphaerae bacterium]